MPSGNLNGSCVDTACPAASNLCLCDVCLESGPYTIYLAGAGSGPTMCPEGDTCIAVQQGDEAFITIADLLSADRALPPENRTAVTFRHRSCESLEVVTLPWNAAGEASYILTTLQRRGLHEIEVYIGDERVASTIIAVERG